jgi:hypothetical protein
MMVALDELQVFDQIIDSVGEKRYQYFRRAGVAFMFLILLMIVDFSSSLFSSCFIFACVPRTDGKSEARQGRLRKAAFLLTRKMRCKQAFFVI